MLTNTQKTNIKTLRTMDKSYRQIADLLGISEDVIRKYCLRNDLNPDENYDLYTLTRCQNCGKFIIQKTNREKKYCSANCRCKNWQRNNTNKDSPKINK